MIHEYELFGRYLLYQYRLKEYVEQGIMRYLGDGYYYIIDTELVKPSMGKPMKSINNMLLYRDEQKSMFRVECPDGAVRYFETETASVAYMKQTKMYATKPVYKGPTISIKLDQEDLDYLSIHLPQNSYLNRMLVIKRG